MKGNHQSSRIYNVVLYGRYSSDLQNDCSIEDQFGSCHKRMQELGWSIIRTYEDRAMSGTSMRNRTGLLELLEDAESARFDVVVVESLDRLSRKASEMALIAETLEEADVELYSLQDGWINDVTVAIRGLESSSFIKKLKLNIRRGHEGAVKRGNIIGHAYGYDVLRTNDQPAGGRVINEEQAAIVRRIFREYISGMSAFGICRRLNEEGIPSPRGKNWYASVLQGQRAAELGILRNRLYIGQATYGKTSTKKKGEHIERNAVAKADWVRSEDTLEHLRIISDEDFELVRLRIEASLLGTHVKVGNKRPKYLLSGLVRCGVCGGTMKAISGRYQCYARVAGKCTNGRRVDQGLLHEFVSNSIRTSLSSPKLLTEFMAEFNSAVESAQKEGFSEQARSQKRCDELNREIPELLAMSLMPEASPSTKRRIIGQMNGLEAELATLESRLDSLSGGQVQTIEPAEAAASLQRQLLDWHTMINEQGPEATAAKEAIRALIRTVTVYPDLTADQWATASHTVTIEGPISAVLQAVSSADGKLKYKSSYTTVHKFAHMTYKILADMPGRHREGRNLEGWAAPFNS